MKSLKLVIKTGGSVIFDDKGPKINYVKALLPVLKDVKNKNQLIFCVGGGAFVKNYEKRCIELLPRNTVEQMDIQILRANVLFFSNLLGMKPLFTMEEVHPSTTGVISGIVPERSTDANAAACAAIIGADMFIKLTSVDGIYDKDPAKHKDAKMLKKIKFSELRKILKKENSDDYSLLDAIAQKTITENKIKTVVAGPEPQNILKIINGENVGTVIC